MQYFCVQFLFFFFYMADPSHVASRCTFTNRMCCQCNRTCRSVAKCGEKKKSAHCHSISAHSSMLRPGLNTRAIYVVIECSLVKKRHPIFHVCQRLNPHVRIRVPVLHERQQFKTRVLRRIYDVTDESGHLTLQLQSLLTPFSFVFMTCRRMDLWPFVGF